MQIVVIAHNIRSTYNIGSIFRTSDGFGVRRIYCTGYTPYPALPGDDRLPHLRDKITRQIHKTALGAEATMSASYVGNPLAVINNLRQDGYTIAALEQDARSVGLRGYHPPDKLALLLGEEVHGITPELRQQVAVLLEIPMRGQKESFNVSVATGIALYELTRFAA